MPHQAPRRYQGPTEVFVGPTGPPRLHRYPGPSPTCSRGPHRARASFAASCCRSTPAAFLQPPRPHRQPKGPLPTCSRCPKCPRAPRPPPPPCSPTGAPFEDVLPTPTDALREGATHMGPTCGHRSPPLGPPARAPPAGPKRPLLPGLTAPSFPGPFRRRHRRQHLLQDRDALPALRVMYGVGAFVDTFYDAFQASSNDSTHHFGNIVIYYSRYSISLSLNSYDIFVFKMFPRISVNMRNSVGQVLGFGYVLKCYFKTGATFSMTN